MINDNHYIFDDLIDESSLLIEYFKRNGQYTIYLPGATIIQQDEVPGGLFFLINGLVEKSVINKDGKKKIFSLHAGKFLAGIISIDGAPSPVTYQCLTKASFYTVPLSTLERQEPRFLLELFRYCIYETGLLQNQLRLATVADSTLNISQIMNEFDMVSKKHHIDDRFVLTHQIIADMIGRTREQVSNLISKKYRLETRLKCREYKKL